MSEEVLKEMGERLRSSMRPVENAELRRDLWPEVLKKLEERSVRVPWFDWALVGLLAVWILTFPQAIPVLLYHL